MTHKEVIAARDRLWKESNGRFLSRNAFDAIFALAAQVFLTEIARLENQLVATNLNAESIKRFCETNHAPGVSEHKRRPKANHICEMIPEMPDATDAEMDNALYCVRIEGHLGPCSWDAPQARTSDVSCLCNGKPCEHADMSSGIHR